MGKRYKITVKNGWVSRLITELNHWHVSPSKYQINGDTIQTTDSNIVDVAYETFRDSPHLLEIVKQ